jgi:serine/threonine-protein kinase
MEIIAARYEVLETVWRSDRGSLLRARDLQHRDRTVALKVATQTDPATREELLAEAGVMLGLPPHRNLPTVRDDFFVDDRYVMVLDWIEGADLARVLDRRGNPGLVLSSVLDAISQAAEALDHLHHQTPPIVHGDVKPSNLVLAEDGRVVLVDFGTATSHDGAAHRAGTRGFVAPEVSAGGLPTPAVDVYGLAATTVTLLTGRSPGGDGLQLDDLDSDAVGAMGRVLRQALSIDPARRPGSAGEFAERLRGGARALPTGVVTLLAVELVGAADLWDDAPEVAAVIADRVDDQIAEVVERNGGVVVSVFEEGTRVLCAYRSPTGALLTARQLHAHVQGQRWPLDTTVELQIAIHTGEVEVRGASYHGATVSRAARLRSSAAAGRTVVSSATVELVGGRAPDGSCLVELEVAKNGDRTQERLYGLVPVDENGRAGARAVDAFAEVHGHPVVDAADADEQLRRAAEERELLRRSIDTATFLLTERDRSEGGATDGLRERVDAMTARLAGLDRRIDDLRHQLEDPSVS